jgi:hypothetical protein
MRRTRSDCAPTLIGQAAAAPPRRAMRSRLSIRHIPTLGKLTPIYHVACPICDPSAVAPIFIVHVLGRLKISHRAPESGPRATLTPKSASHPLPPIRGASVGVGFGAKPEAAGSLYELPLSAESCHSFGQLGTAESDSGRGRRSPGVWNLNCTFRPEPTLAGGPRHRLRLTPMSDTFSKVEVITGIAERRRFSADLKLAVVG